ncbi:MAG TPA: PKD domain-containing protein, partial [Chitinophagaceae bacterium]|nr:PKD domain-containing protein [Chitinophagaceae bacterium]
MANQLIYTLSRLTLLLSFHLLVLLPHARAQAPVANFNASITSGCSPLTVHFTDASTGNPFSWTWDFGNGQLSTQQNPVITYATPGVYTVRLVVRNTSGIDEEIKTNYIVVSPGPTAQFTANITTACVPATIQFTDQSSVPAGGGTITSWSWSFGDGNTSNLQNPSHTYTSTGFYTISLTVTTSTGCSSTTALGNYIRIVDGIDADFIFTEPGTCTAPFVVNFTDQSQGPGVFTYLWDFGNGGPTSTLQNPSATYPGPGTYTVTLTVQSSLGCSGTTQQTITIAGKTTDFIAPSSICIGQTITLQNNSSPAPVGSTWDFGDGTSSSQINAMKTYTAPGTYSVLLINDYGSCQDSIRKTVTVIAQPVIDFIADDSTSCTAPFTVQFTDRSPTVGTSWLWDFGDGNTSTQQNPSHTYTAVGNYTVTLTATMAGGCSGSFTKTQYIQVQPVSIGFANLPAGDCVPFTFSPLANIVTVDPVVSYTWDMGEPGAIYNTQNPTHTYTTPGVYTITLTVTTQSGCTQTQSFPGGVLAGTPPVVNFSFTPNNVCASTPVQFTDLSTTTPGASVGWQWLFGDGQTSGDQNPLHQYVDTGALNVSLIVSNN